MRPLAEEAYSEEQIERQPRVLQRDSVPADRLRSVNCFDCEKTFSAPKLAESTMCPSCGSYADLRDVDISHQANQRICTRGSVTIRPSGSLLTTSLRCNDLTALGELSAASIECDGTFFVGSSGVKLTGKIMCETLVIEKGVRVAFLQPVSAKTVTIRGIVEGDLRSDGHVNLLPSGSVLGDISAHRFSMEQGATFDGIAYAEEDAAVS